MLDAKKWMPIALKQAQQAAQQAEVPVGAVIVRLGSSPAIQEFVAGGHNCAEKLAMATRHAEIEAIEKASQKLGRWRLHDCVLYTSLEPCVMCVGAIMAARLKAVVYGAADPKSGGAYLLQSPERFHHKLQLIGPVDLRGGQLLQNFFAAKRAQHKGTKEGWVSG